MLSNSINEALNEQINAELYSSYLYYSMSAYFEDIELPGIAGWMRVQALEELTHAHKFYKYIADKDGRVLTKALDAPPNQWESALDAMQAAHNHEHHISKRINDLVTLARKENDHATENFLQWFVSEQVEEEASTWEAVRKLKLIGNEGSGLYMVDNEFKTRTFVYPPPALAEE